MTIALTPSQNRNYSWLRSGQTGAFALYLASVIASMNSPLSPSIKPVVTAVLFLLVTSRIGYVLWTAREDTSEEVIKLCKRDAWWQLARVVAILLFAFVTTSLPVVQQHLMVAAVTAALLATASSLGDQVFTVPVEACNCDAEKG